MKIILLGNGDPYDYWVEGLYRITDESYSQIGSLRFELMGYEREAGSLPTIDDGTRIYSWSLGPLPKSKPLSDENRIILERRRQIMQKVRTIHTKIREVIQFGESISYETVD